MIEEIDIKGLNDWKLSEYRGEPIDFDSISIPHQIFKLAKKLNEIIKAIKTLEEKSCPD